MRTSPTNQGKKNPQVLQVCLDLIISISSFDHVMSTIMCMTAPFGWLDIALLLYVRSISNSLIYLTLVSVIQGLRSCRLSSSRIQEYYRLMKNNINLTPKTRSGYKIFETCLKRRKHGKWITSGVLNNTYLSSFSTKSTTETFSFRTKSKTIRQ